jgi:DnaJ homolog subfamily C member 11
VPILLADVFDFPVLVYAVVFPLCSAYVVDHFWWRPKRLRAKRSRVERLRERLRPALRERRQAFIDEQQLLRSAYERKVEQERQCEGLVIVKAFYGHLDVSADDHGGHRLVAPSADQLFDHLSARQLQPDDEYIDVTSALQMLVDRSHLSIPSSTKKSQLLGFYDPCPWYKEKMLLVRYVFQSRQHQVVVRDRESLTMPVHAHLHH